jgi:hypothetical protein
MLTCAEILQAFGGAVFATFKLHLAAFHLPDQVRSSGAAFFCLEYWVERMVQLFKRMIKYRSTAYPALLFVHDHMLTRACERARRSHEDQCLSVDEALEAVRATHRVQHDEAVPEHAKLLGAPKIVTPAERQAVLHPQHGDGSATGLGRLLYDSPKLEDEGWPALAGMSAGQSRQRAILRALGLPTNIGAGDDSVIVQLQKFVRAELPVGDAISSEQCRSQGRKDNSWCYISFGLHDGQTEHCVCHFEYFVKATFTTRDGLNVAVGCAEPASPLRLGVGHLYHCEIVDTPGARQPDAALGRPPEFFRVRNLATAGENRADSPYLGKWVLDLRTFTTQLVPTRELRMGGGAAGRCFMTANKASGRTTSWSR